MKAVFAVCAVAILLCGCNAVRFRERKVFPLRNRALRDGAAQMIRIKPLPCSFGVKYEDIDSTYTIKGEYKFYNYSEIVVEPSVEYEGQVYIDIKRVDIPAAASGNVWAVQAYDEGDSCSVREVYPTGAHHSVFYLSGYLSPGLVYCDEVKEATWEGKKCTNCSADSGALLIEDGHVIGYQEFYSNRIIKFEYKFDDFHDDFVLNKDCKDDNGVLPEDFYSAPSKVKGCKAELLSAGLKKLPCTFGVKYNMTDVVNGEFKRYGKSTLDVYVWTSELGITYTRLVRADIHDSSDPQTGLHVLSAADDTSCSVSEVNYIIPSVYFFTQVDIVFNEYGVYDGELYCDTIEDATFDGKKCKACATLDSSENRVFLFVKDGLVIGMTSDDTSMKLEYEFEDFRSDFTLKCNDSSYSVPEEVYSEPPKEEDCGHKPKGDDDVASSLSVAASMIICMSMITLISLF